ncbi:CPBP family intramembrane metalloprotease [Amycolatopsis thermalba]|uniref:CPBP family intramembrane metalloprotease n=1 Tax=Amycolatopsis thermalba TaxID=944492 RepID=A0ABY4NSI5_9PSEU|nr:MULTISPECIES: CPBP family intramembrane glutamic endopeptidase [Amycolatopsis]UQS22983.1 CPBP family intramembrane metalloprotease [Amycolatopsis thermalba]
MARALVMALAGTCVMAVALGTAGAIAQAVHSRTGLDGVPRQALAAVICLVLAVSLIVLLRRGVDHRPMSGLGLTGPAAGLRSFGLGVLVTGGSAAALLGAGTWAGWLAWGPLDAARLVEFVVVNALIAVALEAFPEELVFRGYVYDTLDQALRRWVAFLVTVVLFTFTGAGSSVVHAWVGALLGIEVPAPAFAPVGSDPVSYAVLYPIFGAVLLIARITTGSLWTSIALHLTYLTVVRTTLDGAARSAGWSATPTTPDALLLVPGFLLLTGAMFLLLGRRSRVRTASRFRRRP